MVVNQGLAQEIKLRVLKFKPLLVRSGMVG